jgi:hypothetical protein
MTMSNSPNPTSQLDAGRTCRYELTGGICGKPAIARGYCSRHYRALARRGAFKPNRPPIGTATTEKGVQRNLDRLSEAKEKLERAAPAFARHLVQASKIAAQKGDSRPAEWGLLHSRAVAPIDATKDEPGRAPIINIGVKVSGIPERKDD